MWTPTLPEAAWPAMRRAGQITRQTLDVVAAALRPGMSTGDIDRLVRRDTATRGGVPAQLGYRPHRGHAPFPGAVCTSVDDAVCHGVPRDDVVLRAGQIVGVDCTTRLAGWHGDTCRTFIVGPLEEASPEARHVVETSRRCRDAGIATVRPGSCLGDIGAAIEALASAEGVSVVTMFGGHGIGRAMHLPPHVSHTGRAGQGIRLKAGMAFTIEPMINLGGPELRVLDDGWTVVTADGSLSAQFEHTILVTHDGAEVLTG